MNSRGDLDPFRLGADDGTPVSALQAYEQLRAHFTETISWYLLEKVRKGLYSKVLRLVSLVLAVVGGAVPLVANAGLIGGVNSSVGYLLLALAGGLQLIDRYFGYSSAWTRYVNAAMRLNAQLLVLQLEFASLRSRGADDSEQWGLLKQYGRLLAGMIETETSQWSAEFHETIRAAEVRQPTGRQR
ncbi:SLATT domain-containing protein [Actinocrispum wychmicini]|uniref:SMODS and SLOG-associating 2TM effector domain-containing protein n=1 Tax=Actinocrispum wychmicini TaxID=1213861 RepID=A0A4R2J3A0_9PSEU|nr:SLATT domain-containing protein [Actinocrispum wychmicini]TCO52903.1 hypothetical protein EV192_11197 [Actinocrispum wychmicini]